MAIGPMKPDGFDSDKKKSKPPTPPPPPPPPTTPNLISNSSGQYSSQSTPPSSFSNRPPGPPMDINAFLGADAGYQDQLRRLAQALSDFQADATRRRGNLETEFGLSQKALNDQKIIDLDLLKDDYGARGMLRSGLYADSVGDYEREFGERVADIGRKQAEALALLQQETGQFTTQQELAQQQARELALRRRAEQFGV